ncbi:hypothetical protein RclHR1_36610001, partial [Rhizophagus clarus]
CFQQSDANEAYVFWTRSGDFVYYNDNNGYRRLRRLRAILKNDSEDYQLRIQKILNYDDLSGNLKGLSR